MYFDHFQLSHAIANANRHEVETRAIVNMCECWRQKLTVESKSADERATIVDDWQQRVIDVAAELHKIQDSNRLALKLKHEEVQRLTDKSTSLFEECRNLKHTQLQFMAELQAYEQLLEHGTS